MHDKQKVELGIKACWSEYFSHKCFECPYVSDRNDRKCVERLGTDALALLKEQEEEHRRLLSWLGKFCRHIDNGDAWLTDEENIAFFKEKMKQQFGWDTD